VNFPTDDEIRTAAPRQIINWYLHLPECETEQQTKKMHKIQTRYYRINITNQVTSELSRRIKWGKNHV